MKNIEMIEWLGYLGSVLIALSLMMNSIIRLRVINTIGAMCFTVYGFTINAMPVAVINALIIVINLYYLTKIFSQRTES